MSQDITGGQEFSRHYKDFFRSLTGYDPFPYQVDFATRDKEFVSLEAPTGLGKSLAVICDFLYHSIHSPKSTPRRLIFQLPLRTLVNQTLETINTLIERSGLEVDVYCLMGGNIEDDFTENPERRAIIVSTLDQLVSRQLNRPYTASRKAALMHFFATNDDVRLVVDETQLQTEAFPTSVKLHETLTEHSSFFGRELVLCSATMDLSVVSKPVNRCSLADADYEHPYAKKKIGQYKKLHLHQLMTDAQLVELIEKEHVDDTLTLVVVNQVKRAQAIFSRLKLPKRLLHSKYRRADRNTLEEGLDAFRGVLVATQVVEAGIDLDARKLFSDICPYSSLVQRCGRCGRNGTYKDADIYVVDVATPLPYKTSQLDACGDIITTLNDVSIKTLMGITAPPEHTKKSPIDDALIQELFDIHSQTPVTELVRDIQNPSVYVAWREQDNLHKWMETADKLELCSLMPNEFSKMGVAEAWIKDEENSTRKRDVFRKVDFSTHKVTPGDTYYIPTTSGHYSERLGFVLGATKVVPEITEKTPKRGIRRGYGSGETTAFGLVGHSCDAANFARRITRDIDLVFDEYKEVLVLSAYLHDIGKAHSVFQETCYGDDPNNPLAKGAAYKKFENNEHYCRPGFRHEAASGLQCMEWELDDLVVWLVTSHHGQIISQFRSLREGIDTEASCCGVWSGDVVPAVKGAWRRDIPRPEGIPEQVGCCFPETTIRLPWEHERRYEDIFSELYETYGPLILAALHTFVRIADHRSKFTV